jgi:hypothetical protein
MSDAVHRDQIYVGTTPSQEVRKRRSILGTIVDAIDHRHLVRGPSTCCSSMCGRRCDHLFNGPLAVEWNEKIAKRIPRGV